jgi:acyl-CoA synthetase (NDP forming)
MKVDFAKLDRAFNPRCIAVVGDKRDTDFMWLRAQSNFKGRLYSVQISPDAIKGIEALGVKNYTSLLDIPEPVDLVIVAVPRTVSLSILEDCIRKEVAAAHFFTAGFAETGTEEGIRLGRLLAERAEQANFHLIGPNCMGVFNPGAGVGRSIGQSLDSTRLVGFISQSGTHAFAFMQEAHIQGVGIGKLVSFGNGTVLDSADYLEYFGHDPEIRSIGMYLEGVRDGRRLLKVLKEVSVRKPVVVWKGGRTEAGGQLIASHTASLAMPQSVWEAAMRQGGAINVMSLEELVGTLKALVYLPPVLGSRVGLAGGSGGQSVVIADAFVETGLELPPLTQESYDELATFFSLVGGSYRNPVDTGNANRRDLLRIMGILERDANVDNLVFLIWPRVRGGRAVQVAQPDEVSSVIEIHKETKKPVMAIFPFPLMPETMQQSREAGLKLQENGVPAFFSFERGARALKNVLDYYNFKNGVDAR